MMNLDSVHPTEIVELPAIVTKGGMISVMTLDMLKLEDNQLEQMAKVMEGTVIYIKMRAVYEQLPEHERMCLTKKCWRPKSKESDWCEDHLHSPI